LFGRTADLPEEVENYLLNYVLQLEERLFGLTRKDLWLLAHEIAEINKLPHRFSHEKRMAADKWYYGFSARHPQISLSQPEATSMARARGFCKENVTEFFTVLDKIVQQNNLNAGQIFKMDETALPTVQKPETVLARKGKHQVEAMTSAERGTTTTCICCMSAAAMFVPPLLVFRRLRFKFELSTGAPPGTRFACTENGWITSDVFTQRLKHFIQTTKPSKETKVLLLLDGYTTHTKNLQAVNLARENGVILLSLPAHTTHCLQPLDVGFLKPHSVYFNQPCDKWMRQHPMRTITPFQTSELLGEAYGRAASVANAVSGFARIGVWPVDPNVFQDSDFAASTLESYSSASEPETANSVTKSQAATSSKPGQETKSPKPKSTTYYRMVNEISPLPKALG
jgi:hypothetical protein